MSELSNNPICPICGNPTSCSYYGKPRKDKLCLKHAKELKEGIIEKCADCGNYHKTNEICNCKINAHNDIEVKKINLNKNHTTSEIECVVCGKPSNGKWLCKECYREVKDYMDSLDKNATISENRNYYYNLKDYAFRRRTLEDVMTNCNKMVAIATNNKNSNDDDSLYDRVFKDVKEIVTKKKKYFEEIQNKTLTINNGNGINDKAKFNESEKEEPKQYFHYSEDGHALDSEMEIKIDDILYSSEIFHCCHKPITEITSHNKTSDWFIPIDSVNKGIYIEYWGMNTPKYVAEKNEKIELYQKYNIPYIEIQKDEPKNNTQQFKANLIREITKKAKEYFGGMPHWKKEKE